MSDKKMITVDEAISLLPDGDNIHTFRNPGGGMLIGGDISREKIISRLKENETTIELTGDVARKLSHGICVNDGSPLFIETNTEKLDLFDPIN